MTKPRGGRTTPANDEDDERFEPRPNGTIKMVFGADEFVLRRPRVGQMREFDERLTEMADAQKTNNALGDDRDLGLDERLFLSWWRDVVAALDRNGGVFPPDEDCPPWLISAPLVTETKNHWRSVPWGPGGSPMQRAAKELQPLLRSLGQTNGVTAANEPE